ncbi:Integrin alpha chain family and FG-GAP repeat and Integrin alpha beta-propellor repeat and Integrin alpha-2 domain-containing protein [Strongyloides ratti]|uniref:Integrin alpha chain family and FG-GAP repeat and Integrin alpha beta-propellor repeat and Integrin alpha-2 domain-containing protein n=1 Tax=Strongyloides ratti TaxID=34506 RepID=A0A090L6M0_STRRB|nr:Integrin alpha chain family and FG-GAP repeat and Integrin alpha beta-propellor repeat and Integrin alpha-2 domain-containing protein [Strongyloides ratti]CEF65392.1 Integrin alpha chain family and FG-GAP repeat and Integrin alpha beta-propellor repeat and Integrin alpha-2 domain-containing protein [Strongyloides ratti]
MRLIFILFYYLFNKIFSFNIDISSPTYKVGPLNSHFGFSVAEHFNGKNPILLIGAPKANSSQPGTISAGAIYSCPLNSYFRYKSTINDKWCSQTYVEYQNKERYKLPPRTKDDRSITIDSKGNDYQLLGASVSSSGKINGRAIVCAPLKRYHEGVSYTDGSCYVLGTDLTLTSIVHNCNGGRLSKQERHNSYGACMQGFSSSIDEEVILTGTIGAKAWTGGVHATFVDKSDDVFSINIDRTTLGFEEREGGIRENKLFEKGDYVGYSVKHGRFGFWYEDKKNFTIVSGSTRHNQSGSVVFFPFMSIQDQSYEEMLPTNDGFMLKGKQIGSGFGYSIEIVDLNNDGFDDLIVGAPYEFYIDEKGSEFHGAVYVYFSSGKFQSRDQNELVFKKPIILRGNLNRDEYGYDDFAVGAPFDDNGAGVIYIYFGSKDEKSFNIKAAQIISASKLGISPRQNPLKSCGFSLSGGSDIDNNGYPDLLVGCVLSDTVVALRSKPIINIITDHSMINTSLNIDGGINCPKGSKTCFEFTTILSMNPSYSKEKLVDYTKDVFICQLETLPSQLGVDRRAKIYGSKDGYTLNWECGKNLNKQSQRKSHKLFISKDNTDWLNPLKLKFSVSIKDQSKPTLPNEGEPLINLNNYPILNKYNSTHEVLISFNKRCGDDDKCESDLELGATFLDISQDKKGKFVTRVGEKDSINIKFIVKNKGERAYESRMYLQYNHDELDVPQLDGTKKLSSVNIESYENNIIIFSLGNPIEPGKIITFHVTFKLVKSEGQRTSNILFFKANVNSTSIEKNDKDNIWEEELEIIKEAELELSGVSSPQMNYFGTTIDSLPESELKYEEDIGPMVKHQYTVTNKGPFYVRDVSVEFDWPFRIDHEDGENNYALYLLETPTIIEADKSIRHCLVEDAYDYINPQKLIIDPSLKVENIIKQKGRNKREVEEGKIFNIPEIKISTKGFLGSKGLEPIEATDSNGSPIMIVDVHYYYTNIEYVQISSSGRIIVKPEQGVVDDQSNNFFTISTHAYPDRPKLQTQEVPILPIILAIIVGLLILGVIILICWKCGFFKRKRAGDGPLLHKAELQYEREMWHEMR